MEGKETEPGQSHPTILLYDDMTKFKNITDESKKEYTVTITLDGASEKEVVPPYNPFIFISSNEGRGKELHLINYPPTDKADLSLLGTGKDIYRPEEGMYYVSADLMPFAINMPVSNLPVPDKSSPDIVRNRYRDFALRTIDEKDIIDIRLERRELRSSHNFLNTHQEFV